MFAPRTTVSRIAWILRIGVAMEFLGHGALGLRHPDAWTAYFGLMGISAPTALKLMPIVGGFDIALAAAVLLYPMRGMFLYMTVWGLFTAALRPLAGESFWETLERAGNYGAPLALYLIAQGGGAKEWLSLSLPTGWERRLAGRLTWVLRLTTSLLLLGHGALGLVVRKPGLAMQYSTIGFHGTVAEPLVGGFELVLAFAVLCWPEYGLLLFVLAWKILTETLSPLSGTPIWVFVEHGGSYAAALGLALLQRSRAEQITAPTRPAVSA